MKISKYALKLTVDFPGKKYSGTVDITGNFDSEILLDAVDLTIDSVHADGRNAVFHYDNKLITVQRVTANKDSVISVAFKGKVTNLLTGLYYAKDKAGGEIFTTQFEATGARRMFPCFDRPDLKAVFSVSVNVDSVYDVISNMPAKSSAVKGDRKTTVFEDTPIMSTYLLYLGIGKLERYFETYNGKEVGLVTLKGKMQSQDHPISASKFALGFLQDYFQIEYVLPKMDVIAVPEFAFGAMENWGAITFREALLVPSAGTSLRVRKRSVEVIAHEIAHQWFGDLVTMKWWNDIWLNESFATFMSIKSTHKMHPDWKYWEYYILDRGVSALSGDSLQASHPISVDVKDPDAIAQLFDEISYGKGSFVLRMAEKFVGEDQFRDGLRDYLPRFKFGNAEGQDLWESIERVSGKPVKKIMGEWVSKQGYPVIRVESAGNKLKLSQERFFLNGSHDDSIWPVPITARTAVGEERIFLETKESTHAGFDYLTFNSGESGFYRVLYDQQYYHRLTEIFPQLSGVERWGILNDSYSFFISNLIAWPQYSRLISVFMKVEDRIVVEEISRQLHSLLLIVPESESVKTLAKEFFSYWTRKIGDPREGEEGWISEVRTSIYNSMVLIDDAFASHLADKIGSIFEERPEIRGSIALAHSRCINNFEVLYEKYSASSNDEDRQRFITAMAWLKGESNLSKFLDLIKRNEIKRQDFGSSFINLTMNPYGREFAFSNYQWIVNTIIEVFRGSVTSSNVITNLAIYCGLQKGDAVRPMIEWISKMPEVSIGLEKGKEYLGIYQKVKSRLR